MEWCTCFYLSWSGKERTYSPSLLLIDVSTGEVKGHVPEDVSHYRSAVWFVSSLSLPNTISLFLSLNFSLFLSLNFPPFLSLYLHLHLSPYLLQMTSSRKRISSKRTWILPLFETSSITAPSFLLPPSLFPFSPTFSSSSLLPSTFLHPNFFSRTVLSDKDIACYQILFTAPSFIWDSLTFPLTPSVRSLCSFLILI